MADKRFRGRDKIVQKMTKDGLVEENLRTGETKSAVAEEPPKQEDSEKDAAESAEETPVVEEDVCMDAEDGEEEKPRRSTAKQSTEYYKAHQEDGKPKEKDAPPVDEDAEPAPKKKGRLSFDDEQQGGIVRGAGLGIKKVAKKGVDTATGFAHNKVHQVEKENSGVESAHKSEETLEGLYRFSKGRKKTREKSARAEKKVEAEKKSSCLKFSENEGGITEEATEMPLKKKPPQPPPTAAGGEATKTVGSKFYQKKQYKDAYAAAKRGQKAGNAASKQAATAANTLAEKAKAAVQEVVVQNKTLWAGLGIAALMLMLIMGAFSSCSAAIHGTGSTFIGTTYPSKDADMKGAEKDYLELSGFEVEIESKGDVGLKRALEEEFDLYILDLMLPGMDGFEICKEIRNHKNTPILMVSAKKDDIDKIRGLGLGADDYMTKPFSPSELVARVKAHMARYERLVSTNMPKNDIVEIRGIKIDKTARRVWVNGEEKAFTTKEFDLLTFLAEHPNHVFTKEELFSEIWDMESIGDIATVTVHIKKIREKIEFNTAKPQYIETIWGVGYRFKI